MTWLSRILLYLSGTTYIYVRTCSNKQLVSTSMSSRKIGSRYGRSISKDVKNGVDVIIDDSIYICFQKCGAEVFIVFYGEVKILVIYFL